MCWGFRLWIASDNPARFGRDFFADERLKIRVKLVAEATAAFAVGGQRSGAAAHERVEDSFAPEAVHFDEAARYFDREHRDMSILPLWGDIVPHAAKPCEPLGFGEAAFFLGLCTGARPASGFAEKQDIFVLIGHMAVFGVVHRAHQRATAGGVGGGDFAPYNRAHEIETAPAAAGDEVCGNRLYAVAAMLAGAQILVADIDRKAAAVAEAAEGLVKHLLQGEDVIFVCLVEANLSIRPIVFDAPVWGRGDCEMDARVAKLGHLAGVADDGGVLVHSVRSLAPSTQSSQSVSLREVAWRLG